VKRFLIILCLLAPVLSVAQHTVHGLVYDAETNTPLPGANVFIANTTKGTSTNSEGAFTITGLQAAPYQLVVQFVGYKTQVVNIDAAQHVRYAISLNVAAQQLNEIVIRAKPISRIKRATYLRSFEEHFIGKADNAGRCTLENPAILVLDKSGAILTAHTDTSLVLRNTGLGYRVKILLQTYQYNSAKAALHYDGHMVYEPMIPESDQQKFRWAKNRLKAYYGSQMHFIRALYNHKANEEGYFFTFPSTIKTDSVLRPLSKLFNNRRIRIPSILDYNKILDSTSTAEKPIINLDGRLEINYINEGESVIFQRTQRIRVQKSMQLSLMKSRAPAEILPDGRFYPVTAIEVSGYWSWELMSESLPLDYTPEEDQKIVANHRNN